MEVVVEHADPEGDAERISALMMMGAYRLYRLAHPPERHMNE